MIITKLGLFMTMKITKLDLKIIMKITKLGLFRLTVGPYLIVTHIRNRSLDLTAHRTHHHRLRANLKNLGVPENFTVRGSMFCKNLRVCQKSSNCHFP